MSESCICPSARLAPRTCKHTVMADIVITIQPRRSGFGDHNHRWSVSSPHVSARYPAPYMASRTMTSTKVVPYHGCPRTHVLSAPPAIVLARSAPRGRGAFTSSRRACCGKRASRRGHQSSSLFGSHVGGAVGRVMNAGFINARADVRLARPPFGRLAPCMWRLLRCSM